MKKQSEFGFMVGTAFILIAGFLRWGEYAAWPAFAAGGVLLIFLAAVSPSELTLAERAWMRFAHAIGWVISRILLAVLYYVVLTPIGLIARASGKRFLDRGPDPSLPTYWRAREESESDYSRQF